jgi:hypothetical protein
VLSRSPIKLSVVNAKGVVSNPMKSPSSISKGLLMSSIQKKGSSNCQKSCVVGLCMMAVSSEPSPWWTLRISSISSTDSLVGRSSSEEIRASKSTLLSLASKSSDAVGATATEAVAGSATAPFSTMEHSTSIVDELTRLASNTPKGPS